MALVAAVLWTAHFVAALYKVASFKVDIVTVPRCLLARAELVISDLTPPLAFLSTVPNPWMEATLHEPLSFCQGRGKAVGGGVFSSFTHLQHTQNLHRAESQATARFALGRPCARDVARDSLRLVQQDLGQLALEPALLKVGCIRPIPTALVLDAHRTALLRIANM